jgi:hypothetical protein
LHVIIIDFVWENKACANYLLFISEKRQRGNNKLQNPIRNPLPQGRALVINKIFVNQKTFIMKAKLLSAAVLLVLTFTVKAQMPRNTVDDYIKCIKECQQFPNSGDVAICEQGCKEVIKCPNVSIRVLNASPKLFSVITGKQVKNGSVLIHTDKTMSYYVNYKNGKINGYELKAGNGTALPFPLLTYAHGKVKRYFIFDSRGKFFEVKKPDVQSTEIAGKVS